MANASIIVKKVSGVEDITVSFNIPEFGIVVVTGKNGAGKSTLVKSFGLISDPQVFQKSSGIKSIGPESLVSFDIVGYPQFSFSFNSKVGVLDSRDSLPPKGRVIAELPVPYGVRFKQFSLVSSFDAEIRVNIASSMYEDARDLIAFLDDVYVDGDYRDLKVCKVRKHSFYFILKNRDYYIREDHLSSGEFFLIQLYRLVTSGAELIIVDELDVALDARAQVRLFSAIQPLLKRFNSKMIVVSHSLAFMETVGEGDIYYLEKNQGVACLERRSFGYVKSDLYGFRGKDRYLITEDKVLSGFLKYLINHYMAPFFEYEIIEVGGQPQIDAITQKNDEYGIFGAPDQVAVVVDKDIISKLKYSGKSKVLSSPVLDIEVFLWENRERFLSDVSLKEFLPAKKDKDTAKTYWKKVLGSKQKTAEDLYRIVDKENEKETQALVEELKQHLCLLS